MPTMASDDPGTQEDVLALLPVLGRAVRARVEDPVLAEDVVQETVARVLEVRWRIDRDALPAYALVVARNLVASHLRARGRSERSATRLVPPPTAPPPDEEVLQGEEHAAVAEALARLPKKDQALLVSHVAEGEDVARIADRSGATAGAVSARLARARARLRVEHLLALRRVEPPTPRCRPVLLAISAGDRRRQHRLDTARHLVECRTCASLAEPLTQRDRSLTALVPAVLALKAFEWVRHSPGQAAAAGVAAGTAAVVATAVLTSGAPSPAEAEAPRRTPTVVPAATAAGPLTVRGARLPDPAAVRAAVGGPVVVENAPVQATPADEGFWIGSTGGQRIWVQMTGSGESPVRVRPGATVSFRGAVAALDPQLPARAGLDADEGADQLRRQGAYLEVPQSAVVVR